MMLGASLLVNVLIALAVAMVISFIVTPIVKAFAQKVNAMDVPKDDRRVHDHPIPRMGGLAILIGFLVSVLLFVNITRQVRGIILGAIVISCCGIVDDIMPLKAWVKLIVQIAAAVLAVAHGVVVEIISNPNIMGETEYFFLGILSVPITIIWIVAVTNAVNLIDGLDGLACGVSAISSMTMLVVALSVSEGNVAIMLAALTGACLGFIPYNLNPAKIFMGDTGALLLGYVLATVSCIGFFKFYAIISFFVPVLALALPLFDTTFAILRRLMHGQNPMTPDRGHLHHKLLDMGLNQKQAVAILYSISAVLGLTAVVLSSANELRLVLFFIAAVFAIAVGVFITRELKKLASNKEKQIERLKNGNAADEKNIAKSSEDAEDNDEKN